LRVGFAFRERKAVQSGWLRQRKQKTREKAKGRKAKEGGELKK
jgi:hypothetical protein